MCYIASYYSYKLLLRLYIIGHCYQLQQTLAGSYDKNLFLLMYHLCGFYHTSLKTVPANVPLLTQVQPFPPPMCMCSWMFGPTHHSWSQSGHYLDPLFIISLCPESAPPQDAIVGIQWGAPPFVHQKGYFTLSPCSTFDPDCVSLFPARTKPAPVSIGVASLLPMTIYTPLYHVYIVAKWIPKCCLSTERAQRLTMSCIKTCYYYSSNWHTLSFLFLSPIHQQLCFFYFHTLVTDSTSETLVYFSVDTLWNYNT